MAKSQISKSVGGAGNTTDSIAAYDRSQTPKFRPICDDLQKLIRKALPKATSKVWHGSPVWFIDDNPVVGYNATAKSVNLLFWNGKAFEEPELKPVGKYGAAQAIFSDAADVDPAAVRRWLKKAGADVFDSKAFFAGLRKKRKK